MKRPDDSRITKAPIAVPILFPKSEEDARKTYLSSGPRAAFAKFYERAASGSAAAQAVLGNIYLNGWVDGRCLPQEAQIWAEMSADNGSACGQWVLAWAHLEQENVGDGISAMFNSADQDFAPALYHLGLFRLTGACLQKNEEAGIEMLLNAAELGHQMSIRTIDHYSRMGKFGLWPMVRTTVLTPLLRSLRYTYWILFKRKFAEDGLTYIRSLLVENNIRRKYGGEIVGIEFETRLKEVINNRHERV